MDIEEKINQYLNTKEVEIVEIKSKKLKIFGRIERWDKKFKKVEDGLLKLDKNYLVFGSGLIQKVEKGLYKLYIERESDQITEEDKEIAKKKRDYSLKKERTGYII